MKEKWLLLWSLTITKNLCSLTTIIEQVIMARISSKPFDLIVVQVYIGTTTHTDKEVEKFYDSLDELLKKNKNSVWIVMGD